MFAAKNGIYSIVKLLLKYKPDVNIKDSVSQNSVTCMKYHNNMAIISYTEQQNCNGFGKDSGDSTLSQSVPSKTYCSYSCCLLYAL